MNVAARNPWRRRMSELSRGVGKPHPPLFAPLLWSAGCQIEAMQPADFTADATKLTRGLVELRRALGLEAIVTACPIGAEAEALGATVDRSVWPPRITARSTSRALDSEEFDTLETKCPALAVTVETTKRIGARQQDEHVILAALTGPGRLRGELADTPPSFETIGRALSALVRRYAEGGANAILLSELTQPADAEGWNDALRTIANIAKFHRIPLLLSFADGSAPETWPGFVVPCPSLGTELTGRASGVALESDPNVWAEAMGKVAGARIALTSSEVAHDIPIGSLQAATAAALEARPAE